MKSLLLVPIVLAIVFIQTPFATAAANDFVISEYAIDYNLDRDSENRSTLTTKETITAVFPDFNQNHGIERYIPKKYNNHSVGLRIDSVLKSDGSAWNYTTYDSDEYTVVRIGDADTYVHGQQTFELIYSQRDVTRYFASTNADEFYWDTNGTAWQVPIASLTVSLTLDKDIINRYNGRHVCYQGQFQSKDTCELTIDNGVYRTSATNLSAGENVTLAIGFEPQTFAQYKMSLLEKLFTGWLIAQVLLLPVVLALIIFLIIRYTRWTNRRSDIGTIVPEYIPPKDASVQVSAAVLRSAKSFSAQLIDLAVRHYIKIYETKQKSFWSSAQYDLEVVKAIDDLTTEEKEFLTDIFGPRVALGSKINTSAFRNNASLATNLMDNPLKLRSSMRGEYGMYAKNASKSAWFKRFAAIVLITAVLLLSPGLLVVAAMAFGLGATLWPLSDKGVELYRYLQGLKMYISVAEEERLRLMQSPEGAQKVAVNSSDKAQLVKLYEKVLPYAILFGQEKSWNKQLGAYYQETNSRPDWYGGANMTAFSAAAFSGAMSSLTSSINSSGASSASTGGSSGGGSSGGGGGGGGGGGW